MSIDLETYSDVDIKKSGVYKYAESGNFEILLFAVSIDGGPVTVYDLACKHSRSWCIATILGLDNYWWYHLKDHTL